MNEAQQQKEESVNGKTYSKSPMSNNINKVEKGTNVTIDEFHNGHGDNVVMGR